MRHPHAGQRGVHFGPVGGLQAAVAAQQGGKGWLIGLQEISCRTGQDKAGQGRGDMGGRCDGGEA